MSNRNPRTGVSARIHEGVPDLLHGRGFSGPAVDAMLDYDLALFKWRRMSEKGHFLTHILKELNEPLELAMFHGLLSVVQISAGIGYDQPQEPTVGLVAERMGVDPSRASRVVSELVARGYVRREASQEDARKTVLVLVEPAHELLRAFSAAKWRVMADVFDGWTSEEITTYVRLFSRYMEGVADIVTGPRAAQDHAAGDDPSSAEPPA